MDPLQVYDNINLGRKIDPIWPNEEWRMKGGRNSWKHWLPEKDMEGMVSNRYSNCIDALNNTRAISIWYYYNNVSNFRSFISGLLLTMSLFIVLILTKQLFYFKLERNLFLLLSLPSNLLKIKIAQRIPLRWPMLPCNSAYPMMKIWCPKILTSNSQGKRPRQMKVIYD